MEELWVTKNYRSASLSQLSQIHWKILEKKSKNNIVCFKTAEWWCDKNSWHEFIQNKWYPASLIFFSDKSEMKLKHLRKWISKWTCYIKGVAWHKYSQIW